MRMQTAVLLGALSLSVSAFAAPTMTLVAGGAATMSVQKVPGKGYKAAPADLHGVQGVYHFDNGRYLQLTTQNRKLYAQFNGEQREELVAVGPNAYASRSEGTQIEFDDLPYPGTASVIKK
jgi:hypothetical protein